MDKAVPLHPEDLVVEIDAPRRIALVEKTNADVDSHMLNLGRLDRDSMRKDPSITQKVFNKFMKDGVPPPGIVLVRWHKFASLTLIPESKLKLLDRSFLIGDVVKRPTSEPMSGIVINTFTKCTLKPVGDYELTNQGGRKLKGFLHYESEISNVRLQQSPPELLVDIPASELKYDEVVNEDDLVVYKDRLGRIDSLATDIAVRLTDNSVVEIPEDIAEHIDLTLDPFNVGDIVGCKKGDLRRGTWIYGQYNPNTPPIGTVVARKLVAATVDWLQRRIGAPETEDPEDELNSDDFQADGFLVYDRATYPHNEFSAGTRNGFRKNTVSYSEIDIDLGRRVRFRDLSGACVKYDGSTNHGKLNRIDRQSTLGYDLNVFEVAEFRTDVTVQWQDLTISHESSVSLVPDSSIDDEHAAWPGEIAHTLDFSPIDNVPSMTRPKKVGVIQIVDAANRMSNVRWCPDGQLSYMELDEGEMPGKQTLITAIIGRAGAEQEELSLYDIECPGELNVRRGDIVLIMNQSDGHLNGNGPPSNPADAQWVGEIVDTCLDGSLTVRLGAAKDVKDVNVPREAVRIAVRSDGSDQADHWDHGESDEAMNSEDDDDYDGMSENDSDMDFIVGNMEDDLAARYEDENGEPLDEDDVENEDWESDVSGEDLEDVDMIDPRAETPITLHSATPPNNVGIDTAPQSSTAYSSGPEQYIILEGSAPDGHHFRNSSTVENSTHMKRVAKEHKILRSAGALPSGVYVRSYESRLDLLRVLFIGPADTPYDSAPFVVDFFLGRSFPAEPPEAYFYSWPAENGLGSVGPVNPNLYEDGKICLSLLGTWDGDKGEGWSAARSTILQVIVSILGLVLVREPYFNEAGYEPLVGLESSRRPSALYTERTFLRASSFIIKPLVWLQERARLDATGITGLEDVVRWLYRDSAGPQLLRKKIHDVETLLRRSEEGDSEVDGLTCMSKGACIPLRRVLARLRELEGGSGHSDIDVDTVM